MNIQWTIRVPPFCLRQPRIVTDPILSDTAPHTVPVELRC
jgi:hypothetical protein